MESVPFALTLSQSSKKPYDFEIALRFPQLTRRVRALLPGPVLYFLHSFKNASNLLNPCDGFRIALWWSLLLSRSHFKRPQSGLDMPDILFNRVPVTFDSPAHQAVWFFRRICTEP